MTKRDKAMLVRMFIFIIKCILKEKHVSIARAGEFGVLENDLREWMNE